MTPSSTLWLLSGGARDMSEDRQHGHPLQGYGYGARFYLDSEVANAVEQEGDFVPEPVSVREREVLLLAARGLSGKEIATQLFISERTVQTHLASIYDKLGAKNKTEAMLLSLKYGIVTLEELLD